MGILRWVLGSRRSDDEEDEEDRKGAWSNKRSRKHPSNPNAYKIEVDGESRQMRGEGPPFSFWSSARVILILSFLLWWIQPAGPMIAGYVGGRRSGSAMKGVFAAILPVVIVLIANTAYTRGMGSTQIDLVASLPQAIAGGAASILPFLMPYKDFLVGYMTGFVKALQSTFGMGTNGYLMVIIFAYIGGLIADQTRRELYYKNGSSQSVGFNLIQPLFGGHRAVAADEDDYEDDEELREMRRPVRARARGHGDVQIHSGPKRRRHGSPVRFEEYRKLNGETVEGHSARHLGRARARDEEDEEPEEEEVVASRTHHAPPSGAREHHSKSHAAAEEEEDAEAVARREAQEARRPRQRSHEEEVAIQRFVERALRQYEHPTR
ncbi:MAG TPA: hypothetical protein VEY12_06020 [Thermoplasmata archaeon]|nr:hypothetical protein [Thermoplasmata archaeon]